MQVHTYPLPNGSWPPPDATSAPVTTPVAAHALWAFFNPGSPRRVAGRRLVSLGDEKNQQALFGVTNNQPLYVRDGNEPPHVCFETGDRMTAAQLPAGVLQPTGDLAFWMVFCIFQQPARPAYYDLIAFNAAGDTGPDRHRLSLAPAAFQDGFHLIWRCRYHGGMNRLWTPLDARPLPIGQWLFVAGRHEPPHGTIRLALGTQDVPYAALGCSESNLVTGHPIQLNSPSELKWGVAEFGVGDGPAIWGSVPRLAAGAITRYGTSSNPLQSSPA